LIGRPGFTGVDQAPEVVARVETHRSLLPIEPRRFDPTNVPPDGSAGVIEGSAQQPLPTQETTPLSTAGTPD
jgi:hypothetical protein